VFINARSAGLLNNVYVKIVKVGINVQNLVKVAKLNRNMRTGMIEFMVGFLSCLIVEGVLVVRYLTKPDKPAGELDPRFGRERCSV